MLLLNQSLSISQAMKPCKGEPHKSIELLSKDSTKFEDIVENNSEEFTEFIEKLGLHVKHFEKTVNAQNSSKTVLTLPTTCFKVDFNDNFARISALK
jgi:hypothetical protein